MKRGGNNIEDRLFDKLDREMEREDSKTYMNEEYGRRYEVIVNRGNVYYVLGEVYKVLKRKNRELHNQIQGYLAQNQKKMSFNQIFDYLKRYVEFVGETDYGERFDINSADELTQLD